MVYTLPHAYIRACTHCVYVCYPIAYYTIMEHQNHLRGGAQVCKQPGPVAAVPPGARRGGFSRPRPRGQGKRRAGGRLRPRWGLRPRRARGCAAGSAPRAALELLTARAPAMRSASSFPAAAAGSGDADRLSAPCPGQPTWLPVRVSLATRCLGGHACEPSGARARCDSRPN